MLLRVERLGFGFCCVALLVRPMVGGLNFNMYDSCSGGFFNFALTTGFLIPLLLKILADSLRALFLPPNMTRLACSTQTRFFALYTISMPPSPAPCETDPFKLLPQPVGNGSWIKVIDFVLRRFFQQHRIDMDRFISFRNRQTIHPRGHRARRDHHRGRHRQRADERRTGFDPGRAGGSGIAGQQRDANPVGLGGTDGMAGGGRVE